MALKKFVGFFHLMCYTIIIYKGRWDVMNNFLGVIGGLGPLASSYFYQLVINKTKVTKDQEHIDMVILNHATIPDRTSYILGKSKENPFEYLKENVKILEKMGAKYILMTCNTSYYFYDELQKDTNVTILNMIEDTVTYIKAKGIKKVMILATTGTIKTKIYQNMCIKHNVEFEVPNIDIQDKVMHIIYENVKKGTEINIDNWHEIINASDSEAYILGCTELSVVKSKLKLGSKYIDPLEVEANKIIKLFGKTNQ